MSNRAESAVRWGAERELRFHRAIEAIAAQSSGDEAWEIAWEIAGLGRHTTLDPVAMAERVAELMSDGGPAVPSFSVWEARAWLFLMGKTAGGMATMLGPDSTPLVVEARMTVDMGWRPGGVEARP